MLKAVSVTWVIIIIIIIIIIVTWVLVFRLLPTWARMPFTTVLS